MSGPSVEKDAGLFDAAPAIRPDATLSEDGLYRYDLTRFWCDPGAFLQRPATFVMLNPSTAALKDDPTIQRCMKFARSWGLDGIRVVNLYAFRTSQPSVLWEALAGGINIVGPENERTLGRALFSARNLRTPVIAAWGNHGAAGRVEWLAREADRWGVELECFGTTQSGAPKHPLARGHHRIPDDFEPIPWTRPLPPTDGREATS
jgi:hypothetical protein